MKYIIYQLVQPECLQKSELDGYYMKTITRSVLQRIDIHGVDSEHNSLELAMSEITDKCQLLKGLELTIIPIVSVRWDGTI